MNLKIKLIISTKNPFWDEEITPLLYSCHNITFVKAALDEMIIDNRAS
jgi:hypothetical protein